jgi:hypothetical protein
MTDRAVGELEIQHAILGLMKDRKVWSNAELKQRLAKVLPWSETDRRASPKRPNERVWENRINNALSQARGSSLYAKGHVENVGHGLHQITERGYKFITNDWSVEDLYKELGL